MFKNIARIILSVVLVLSVVAGCSSTAGFSNIADVSSQQTASLNTRSAQNDNSSHETSSEQKNASTNDESSIGTTSHDTASWVCPNPSAHNGTCTNQANHNRLVAALETAKREVSNNATSSSTSSRVVITWGQPSGWQCPDPDAHPSNICVSEDDHNRLAESHQKYIAEQEAKIARLHAQYPQWWNEDGSYNYPEGYGQPYYVDEKGLHKTGLKEWCICCNCPVGDGYDGTCYRTITRDANGGMYNWHVHYDLGERWLISGEEVKYKEKL